LTILTLTIVTFRGYIRLYLLIMVWTREEDRGKIPPDIILKAVRTVKLHNLSIWQVVSEFNMNYRTLSCYCKKILEEDYLHEDIVI